MVRTTRNKPKNGINQRTRSSKVPLLETSNNVKMTAKKSLQTVKKTKALVKKKVSVKKKLKGKGPKGLAKVDTGKSSVKYRFISIYL